MAEAIQIDVEPQRAASQGTVSVVVCTWNRAAFLTGALRSLCNQDFKGFEIVVVDNASTDDTRDVVEEIISDFPEVALRYLYEPKQGILAARNRGYAESTGDWIAFFDDDQLAEPQWLSELMATAQRRDALCVGGRVQLKMEKGSERNLGPLCRDLLSETGNVLNECAYHRRFKPGTGNLLVHRSAMDAVDAFSMSFEDRGEDTVLFLRLGKAGYSGWYNPQAIVHHCIPSERLSDEYFVKMARQAGRNMPNYEKHHWGWLFPLAWFARIGQFLAVVLPAHLYSILFGDKERRLETRCRMVKTGTRILYGAKFLFRKSPIE